MVNLYAFLKRLILLTIFLTALIRMSASSFVLNLLSEILIVPRDSSGLSPMAVRTWLGLRLLLEQALPVLTAIPSSSR